MDKAAWSRLARFALLMPARVGEISTMRWGDVDLTAADWEQPARTTKNGDAHTLPLPPAALGLLEEQRAVLRSRGLGHGPGGTRFGLGPKSGKPIYQHWGVLLRRLRAASGVSTWSWHHFRRTTVTHLAEAGVAESVADALLNHRQSATRGGVLRCVPAGATSHQSAARPWSCGRVLLRQLRPRRAKPEVNFLGDQSYLSNLLTVLLGEYIVSR